MIKINLEKIEKAPEDWSEIFEYREDLAKLKEKVSGIGNFENIIVVGNGGSITSYDAYFWALCSKTESETVWTMDPAFLERTRRKFSRDNTVVVAISKSGNTLGQIESLSYFYDYAVVVITDPDKGTLSEIAKKMSWRIIEHPPIGGRFSGGTSSAFVPALLAGIDVGEVQNGMIDGYKLKNEAFSLSKYYFELEKKGYGEIYVTCYAELLKNFENLVVQLMHESVCKDNKGQTFYFSMGPEAQHHTNQRFLGGKKNVIGTFIIVKKPSNDLTVELPENVKEIDYKGSKLEIIDNLKYQDLLNAEYEGTKQDADKNNVPNITIEVEEITPHSVGMMVAFWHLVAFYSSKLRDVNPFDQPAVENSKNITLDIIKEKLG